MWTKPILLTPLLIFTKHTRAARSIAARRIRPAAGPDRYDRSITTFSPEGRLLQLEYALVAAEERGWGLTVCVEWDGAVVFAFPSSGSRTLESFANKNNGLDHTVDDEAKIPPRTISMEQSPSHNTKIHRLSPTHLLLTSGLAGDSRALASAFRRLIASWTHIQYGESISVKELAREIGTVRHGIGLRPGARVLGVVGVIIGLEDVYYEDETKVEVRMYKSLPGGTIDRCNICCTGGGADSSGMNARKETMEALSRIISLSNEELADFHDEEMPSTNRTSERRSGLQRIIEEVGKVALKYHPYSLEQDSSSDDEHTDRAAVDIWVVRAVSASKPAGSSEHDFSNNSIGPAFVSPHRQLGDSAMTLRYASRVTYNQLPTAVQCLMQKVNQ
jgi:20S proteasome alpha/beta subunit